MSVKHPRFLNCQQLQAASIDSPPLKKGAIGEGVRLVQEALRDLKYPLPISTLPDGKMDGNFGSETKSVVQGFQRTFGLSDDGQVGKNTLARLEKELQRTQPTPPTEPDIESYLPFNVWGWVPQLLQRDLYDPDFPLRSTESLCWAAAVTTMRSWRSQMVLKASDVVEDLGSFYQEAYERGDSMPTGAYGLLLERAGMKAEPPLTVPTPYKWYQLLVQHGLLWVGAKSDHSPNAFLHSFIIKGMFVFKEFKDPDLRIRFEMQQPGSAQKWNLSVAEFNRMLQRAAEPGYYQIRYYANRGGWGMR